MATESISFIGSTLEAVVGAPATEDQAGYEALVFVEVGKIVSFGALGDTSTDITVQILKLGRVCHVNGAKDLGNIPVSIVYDRDDVGQDLVRTNVDTNTNVSFKVTDFDGDDYYFQGLFANNVDNAREPGNIKGSSFVIRGNTGITSVEGP